MVGCRASLSSRALGISGLGYKCLLEEAKGAVAVTNQAEGKLFLGLILFFTLTLRLLKQGSQGTRMAQNSFCEKMKPKAWASQKQNFWKEISSLPDHFTGDATVVLVG